MYILLTLTSWIRFVCKWKWVTNGRTGSSCCWGSLPAKVVCAKSFIKSCATCCVASVPLVCLSQNGKHSSMSDANNLTWGWHTRTHRVIQTKALRDKATHCGYKLEVHHQWIIHCADGLLSGYSIMHLKQIKQIFFLFFLLLFFNFYWVFYCFYCY